MLSTSYRFLFVKLFLSLLVVLTQVAGSRGTITNKTQEMHKVVLRPLVVQNVNNSPYWSLICDESCDGATQEQLGLYVRYINLEKQKN